MLATFVQRASAKAIALHDRHDHRCDHDLTGSRDAFPPTGIECGVYYMRPDFMFDSILIGACLALAVVSNEKYFEWVQTAARNIPAGLLWVLLLAWSAMVSISNPVYLTVQEIVIVMLLAQIIAGASASSVTLFEWPVLTYLGKISYFTLLVAAVLPGDEGTILGCAATIPNESSDTHGSVGGFFLLYRNSSASTEGALLATCSAPVGIMRA